MLSLRNKNGYIWIAEQLRTELGCGIPSAGKPLMPIRSLAGRFGVSPETVRRALKCLEQEGLIISVPSHGFRAQAKGNDPQQGQPIAVVLTGYKEHTPWQQAILSNLQDAASERGWPLLALGGEARPVFEIAKQLQSSRASGLILSTSDAALLSAVKKMGLATVMVDSWESRMELDAIVQDSFQGALRAAEYLIEKGHRRIAWLGPISNSIQSRERFGGAVTALYAAGLAGEPEFFRDTPHAQVAEAARALLTRVDRPTAILALWENVARTLLQVAAELNLRPGKDFEVVTWMVEDLYQAASGLSLDSGLMPPTMVWSMADVARAAINRLAERRQNAALPPVLIKIPVRLRLPNHAGS
jgi:DNA-binding LacI/PurR family transcriptional regulator